MKYIEGHLLYEHIKSMTGEALVELITLMSVSAMNQPVSSSNKITKVNEMQPLLINYAWAPPDGTCQNINCGKNKKNKQNKKNKKVCILHVVTTAKKTQKTT